MEKQVVQRDQQDDLIGIKDLCVNFYTQRGIVQAVRDISFSIKKGETLALVGESGCGKSVTAHSINQLIPVPPGKIEKGSIFFEGQDLLLLSEKEMREIRGP
jgi:ABC-type dipeptide/oligopeptide/nickel transport system ATPase component